MGEHIRIFIFFSILISYGYSQKRSCIDSISSYNLTRRNLNVPYPYITQVVDNSDNLVLQVDSVDSYNELRNLSLIKLNPDNTLIYSTLFTQNSKTDSFKLELSFCDTQNELIISGGSIDNSNSTKGIITKLDSLGNMKWQKIYKDNDGIENCFIQKSIAGKNNDVVILMYGNEVRSRYRLCLLDSAGNIKWTKKYNSSVPFFYRGYDRTLITLNGTDIILCGQVVYGRNSGQGFFITKINYLDGNLIQSKSFSFTDSSANFLPQINNELRHLNYDPLTKKYLIGFWPDSRLWNGVLEIIFDTSFNPIVNKVFNFGVINAYGQTSINTSNFLNYCYSSISDNSLLSAVIDDNLNIFFQKKIPLGSFPHNSTNFRGLGVFRKNRMDYQISSFGYANADNILILGSSNYYSTSCATYDTVFLIPQSINLSSISFKVDTESPLSLTTSNTTLALPVNRNVSIKNICKQISICDSIKIIGEKYYCVDNNIIRFKLYKNRLCLRHTQWKFDSGAIKLIDVNDTTMDVIFLTQYYGYIYAGFSGCDLSDSLFIDVYENKKPVNLGRDTILCAGKTLTLHAGIGYRTYEWQDGSNEEFFIIKQAGIYSITVTDSCGNSSKDTILINDTDVILRADYPYTLCLNDTAIIQLDDRLNIYNIQPPDYETLTGNTLLLYPSSTTLYTIYGNNPKDCPVSDTLLIKVKRCPQNVYFPNAFTPNNDGLNDSFKPFFDGNLTFYELRIYNQWGQVIFKTSTPGKGWDGNFLGSPQSKGAYVWLCRYKFVNQNLSTRKGNLVLIK